MPDTLDTLGQSVGLRRETLFEIWGSVKANSALLEKCTKHDFLAENPSEFGSKWVCSACGGKVDSVAAGWYKKGLLHANQ